MKKTLLIAALAMTAFASAPSAASAATTECPDPNPLTKPIIWYQGGEASMLSYTVEPANAFTSTGMSGKTVKLTITGKTTAEIPLAFFSYQTQSPNIDSAWPQKLYDHDEVVLRRCETVTLEVAVPSCHYQIDFLYTGPGHPGLESELKTKFKDIFDMFPSLSPVPGFPNTDMTRLKSRLGQAVDEQDIQDALFPNAGMINGQLGGNANCFPTTTTTTTTTTNTNPPQPPTTTTRPVLPPVTTGTVGGAGTTTTPSKPRACTSVKARSYRVRAKQKNTVTVTVKSTAKTKPTVTLKGAGVSTKKKVNSKGTVTFRVTPKKSGSIRVTASGCAKTASVKVAKAKSSKRSGTSPTFTG